jgi:OXA1/YqjG-like inner membrane protein
MLLTLPFLFAMYAVIKQPTLNPSTDPQHQGAFVVTNNHLPEDSALFQNVLMHQNTDFLFMNLQCNLVGAGTQVPLRYKDPSDGQVKQLPGPGNPDPNEQEPAPILGEGGEPLSFDATTQAFLDCGTSRFPDIIPYVLVLILMVGLTFFQTFQIQRVSPPAAQSSQQQQITRLMPLLFAFFGLQFPAGLLVYWTVSNGLQIAQQTYLIRKGHIGPEALERQIQAQKAKAENAEPKRGIMSWVTDMAQGAQSRRDDLQKQRDQNQKPKPSGGAQRGSSGRPKKGGPGQAKKRSQPPADPKSDRTDPGSRGKRGVGPGNQLKRNPQPDPPEDDDE